MSAEQAAPRHAAPAGQVAPSDIDNDERYRLTDRTSEVACPACGAAAGERCRPHRGLVVHAARTAAWRSDQGAALEANAALLAAAGMHDEATSYCTNLPAHGDELHNGIRESAAAAVAADDLAMARDLEDVARRNLAGLQQDMRELARQVADAGRELAQAEQRVAELAPPKSARTADQVRAWVSDQMNHYDDLTLEMSSPSARDAMRTAYATVRSVRDYIDGNL